MGNYNLPKISDKHRWYLARYSRKYGCLKLQIKTWRGWVTIGDELVSITGRPFPIDVAIRQAADDIIKMINAPEIKYGVLS